MTKLAKKHQKSNDAQPIVQLLQKCSSSEIPHKGLFIDLFKLHTPYQIYHALGMYVNEMNPQKEQCQTTTIRILEDVHFIRDKMMVFHFLDSIEQLPHQIEYFLDYEPIRLYKTLEQLEYSVASIGHVGGLLEHDLLAFLDLKRTLWTIHENVHLKTILQLKEEKDSAIRELSFLKNSISEFYTESICQVDFVSNKLKGLISNE